MIRDVRFAGPAGELSGTLWECDGCTDILVFVHGFLAGKNHFFYPRLSELLSKRYNVLTFDMRGVGASVGPHQASVVADEVADVRAATSYVESLGFTVSALVGHSKGALDALLCGVDQTVDVVAICPPFDLKRVMEHQIAHHDLQKVDELLWKTHDGAFVVPHTVIEEHLYVDLSVVSGFKGKVLLIRGANDGVVLATDMEQYISLISNSSLVTVEHAGHFFAHEAEELCNIIVDWLD